MDLKNLDATTTELTLTSVTAADLADLTRLTALESLYLRGTGVTDEALVHIASLTNLLHLDIHDSP